MLEHEFDTSKLRLAFHEVVESRRDVIVEATDRIMSVIRAMPCAEADLDGVRLALNEALANAVIHGNKEDPNKKVSVWGACDADENLLLVITDEGEGFDVSSVPDPTRAENICSTRGRGIFIINLMCEAEYRLGGRQVVLRKRLRNSG